MPRKDPHRVFRFLVEVDGLGIAGFSEATVPDTNTDVVEYREGNEATRMRKLSGLNKYGNITLKVGTTDDTIKLHDWRKQVIEGKMSAARRNIAIILMDEEGTPAARWEFENAWPTKYDPADLSAKGTDVAIETLEIAHEGMKRVK